MTEADLPEDLPVCNCADCGRLLVGRKGLLFLRQQRTLPEELGLARATFVNDRPYCKACLEERSDGRVFGPCELPLGGICGRSQRGDTNHSWDNGVRAREDGGGCD